LNELCDRAATRLAPEDAEIAFNLAAVLEAVGRLEDALTYYKRSKEFGVERAAVHIRNVGVIPDVRRLALTRSFRSVPRFLARR
jgi:Flp pilus assembly protein TadD